MAVKTMVQPRAEVAWFADHMEEQLRTEDHRRHWREESHTSRAFLELKEAVDKLKHAMDLTLGSPDGMRAARVVPEAARVAVRAMMIADMIAQGARKTPRPRVRIIRYVGDDGRQAFRLSGPGGEAWALIHPDAWSEGFVRCAARDVGVSETEMHRAVQLFLAEGEAELFRQLGESCPGLEVDKP